MKKTIIKKNLAMLLTAVLAVSTLTGCVSKPGSDDEILTSSEPPSTENAGESAEEPVQNTDPVQIWVGAGATIEDFQKLAQDYKTETGIDVEVIEFTDLSATDKLALDGPAGNGGDIYYQGGGGSLGKAVEQGLFMEITEDMTDLSLYTDSALANFMYGGKLYGVPTGVEVPALIYNKDFISEIPATWEELVELAQSMNDFDADSYGLLFDAGNPYFTNCFTDAYGGYVFKETADGYDINDIGINNDGAKKAFSLFTGYVTTTQLLPKNMEFALMQQNFKDGKAAVIYDGPWSVSMYQEAGIDVGVAPVPPMADAGNTSPRVYSGAYGYCISAYAKNPVGAMQFIEYIAADADNAKIYFDRTKRTPALKALIEMDEIKNDPIQNGFALQAVNSFPQPNIPQMDITWGPLMEAYQAVVNENFDPDAALDSAASKLKDSIQVMGQ